MPKKSTNQQNHQVIQVFWIDFHMRGALTNAKAKLKGKKHCAHDVQREDNSDASIIEHHQSLTRHTMLDP